MRKTIILFVICLVLFGVPVLAGETIRDLANKDSGSVAVVAEVIGRPLKSKDGVWFNLFDQEEHISVWAKDTKHLETITHWGNFKANGDRVRIEGVYNRLCQEHGISDIHLEKLSIYETGYFRQDFVSPRKYLAANLSLVMCLTIALIYLIKVRKQSRSNKA